MKKNYLLNVLVLCCGLFVCTIARAESDKDEPSNTKSEVAQANNDDLTKQVNKLLKGNYVYLRKSRVAKKKEYAPFEGGE